MKNWFCLRPQNLPMKDSRLNQFKENDQSFVYQSTAGTVQNETKSFA